MRKTWPRIRRLGRPSPAELCIHSLRILQQDLFATQLQMVLNKQTGTEAFISLMCNIFPYFSGIFPKLFVLHTSESRGLSYGLKIEWGNWSSLRWDKTKWNNKCYCIYLEFSKCCPISCIFSPLPLELLVPYARWLSCTLDHVYPISYSVTCFHLSTYC